jgi:hypothetical protein
MRMSPIARHYTKHIPVAAPPFEANRASRAHLHNSPPSLLMIGNNFLKQLTFGARANSPVPICRKGIM